MWRSLLILATIVLALVTDIGSARADEFSWVPPPQRRSDSANMYIATGISVFGLAYVPSLTIGSISLLDNTGNHLFHGRTSASLAWHVIPGLGPFAYAINPSRDTAWDVESPKQIREAQALSIASGLVQMAGLALFTYGVATTKSTRLAPQPRAPQWSPMGMRGGVGVSMTMDL